MEWIETSFAWPHPQMWVLTFQKSGQMKTAFMDYVDGQMEWMDDDLEFEKVTHWRKLPEPPEKPINKSK